MDKLKELNQIQILDYSVSNGELEYIMIENTEENRDILTRIGATKEDFEEMEFDNDDTLLDITLFPFSKLDAAHWDSENGFTTLQQLNV